MRNIFAFMVLGGILFSCVDNEPPTEDVLSDGQLIVNIPSGYISNSNENWVIIHDLAGIPIASKKVEVEEPLIFELDDSQRYHITTYRNTEAYGTRVELIESFTDILVNEDFSLGLASEIIPAPPIEGEFEVNFSDTQYPFGAYVSSKVGGYYSYASRMDVKMKLQMSYLSGVTDYLLVAKNSLGQNRYKFLSVPSPGATFNYTFSELSEFDKVFQFNSADFSQFTYRVMALEESNNRFQFSYILNNNIVGMIPFPTSRYEVGFLNALENYDVSIEGVMTSDPKKYFNYRKIGKAPTTIDLPALQDIEVQKMGLDDFQFKITDGTNSWIAVWDQSTVFTGDLSNYYRLQWRVMGSKSAVKLKLPEELTKNKPKLQNLGDFKFLSIQVFKHSFTYDKQIRTQLMEIPKLEEMEFTAVRQFFDN